MNTRNQEAWDALRQERDDLLLAIDRCEETKTALHMNLRAMRDERDELAALVEVMRDALRAIAMDNRAYTMAQNAVAALALPNTAADILRQRDARVLRDAASRFSRTGPSLCVGNSLDAMADELENGK